VAKKRVTEWMIPRMLVPDIMPPTLQVSLGVVTRTKSFIAMAEINTPPSIVTIIPKSSEVRVHTYPATGKAKIFRIGAVCATPANDVWFVSRAGPTLESAKFTIGRMRPDTDAFEFWPLPISAFPSTAIAVERDGRAIWVTSQVSFADRRHALIRLDPAENEITFWTLAQSDSTQNFAAQQNAEFRGPVAVPGSSGTVRHVWWLLTSPREGESGRLIHLDPVTGAALDFGPPSQPPASLGRPWTLTLDGNHRPWVGFGVGAAGRVTDMSCGQSITLVRQTVKVKPRRDIMTVRQAIIPAMISPISPVVRRPPQGEVDCYQTFELSDFAFRIVGGGVLLASRDSDLFVSNGRDKILQLRP
jgi:hypothetical protein